MESLSPKQVSEIKDLYASVYKAKEEVEEASGTPSSLEEEVDAFTDELVENVVKSLQDKLARSDRAGVFGQLERLRRKAFGTKDESDKVRKYEINKNIIDKQKNSGVSGSQININKDPNIKSSIPSPTRGFTPEGEKQAAVNKMEFKKNKEIEALKKKNAEVISNNKVDTSSGGGLNLKDMSKYSPTKDFDSNTFKSDTSKSVIKPEVKTKMNPIEVKNRARFGDARVDMLKAKNIDFKSMRKGDMTKDAFIKKYPKSITAQKASGLRDEYEPYDLVLDYVLSEGHADTVEEAHYVMTQMDAETIQTIVEFIGGRPGDGYIGHPNLDIKNPFFRGKRTKGPVLDKSNANKLPDVNVNKVGATIGDRNMRLKKMIDDI